MAISTEQEFINEFYPNDDIKRKADQKVVDFLDEPTKANAGHNITSDNLKVNWEK